MGFKKKWRLIILKNLKPICVNAVWHAVALSISNTTDINAILLTTTSKPSLSCGYHQNLYEEVDLGYCEKNNIALVRRLAGGGLVLLDKNQVFYNVIFSGFGFPTPIKNLYSYALKGPDLFLKNLNLNSKINYNEINIEERKISGTGASSIENSGVVIGNIILDFDYEKFCDSLNVPSENFRQMVRMEIRKNLTTLINELKSPPSIDEIIEGLKKAFETAFKSELIEDELSEFELHTLNELEVEYKQKEWNFRRKHEKSTERYYIKIKKGTCIIHEPSLKSNILVSDGYIKKVQAENHNDIKDKIIGENIFTLKKKFPEFENLQNNLIKYFELSNI
ncbi:MAG: lipoate--protein ligase family protein [Candidatus Helarchaeota archaeon]